MIAVLLEALAVVAALVCAALAYRAFRQHLNARAFAIQTRSGMDEALFVRIGGIDQWVQIRSEDRADLSALGETFHGRTVGSAWRG